MPFSFKLKNFLSSVFFVVISYILIRIFHKNILENYYYFSGLNLSISLSFVFDLILFGYIVILAILYFIYSKNEPGKGILALRALKKIISRPIDSLNSGLPKDEKTALLAIAVKFFFTPLVIGWFFGNGFAFYSNFTAAINSENIIDNFFEIFRRNLFWAIFNFILLVDVLFFSIGYLFEFSFLKNQILSVEPTFLGWAVTLICYPPFNSYANSIIGWSSSDFPHFENKLIFLSVNILILVLMGIFSWASVSLGFKASNLTHRGIVGKGPYRYIRHPAYACKSMAWWLGGIPFVLQSSKSGVFAVVMTLIPLIVWSCIYFLRAMTEEAHLRKVNHEYDEYAKKVKYKFVPYIV